MNRGNWAKAHQKHDKGRKVKPERGVNNRAAGMGEGKVHSRVVNGVGSINDQAALLSRFDRPQRQEIISRVGREMGNRHVQRLLSVTNTPGTHVFRREAFDLERRAWLSFFDHPLPRKFLNNYMDDTGAAITLTEQEMIGCNPIVDIRRMRNNAFQLAKSNLHLKGGGTQQLSGTGWGGARTNGTLGNFTINWKGTLTVQSTGHWSFSGTMSFYDVWDFDPKPFGGGSGRPVTAEIKTRVAHHGLPGKPFEINSVDSAVSQGSGQPNAIWAGGNPKGVPGPARRAALDVGAGAEAGGGTIAVGGPDIAIAGAAGGGDVGANMGEDLNP